MPTRSLTAEEAVERYWKTIKKAREVSLTESLLFCPAIENYIEHLRNEPADPERFQKFLDEFAEMAWKCGFADALWAMSNGVIQTAKIEDN
jgi:hypothetical protein